MYLLGLEISVRSLFDLPPYERVTSIDDLDVFSKYEPAIEGVLNHRLWQHSGCILRARRHLPFVLAHLRPFVLQFHRVSLPNALTIAIEYDRHRHKCQGYKS